MNSSQFMDKQIMDLSRSPNNDKKHNSSSGNKDDILPNYDFQPIRPVGVSNSVNLEASNNGSGVTRVWNSADSKPNTSRRNHSYLDPDESTNFIQGNDRKAYDTTMLSEIDRTMKKHADILLHSLEGVSARLTQMETRTRKLESMVDDLKVSVENDHGSSDGKLRQLENILREVHTGVQVFRDKQEIAEAHLHLAKLQASKGDQQPEVQHTGHLESVQQTGSAPLQLNQTFLPQVPQPPLEQIPLATPPNGHPPQTQQNPPPVLLSFLAPLGQMPSSAQRDHYFQPPGHLPEGTHQLPPTQQLQPPPPVQPQRYQSAQIPKCSQSTLPPQQHQPIDPVNLSTPQLQPLHSHTPDEIPYMPPQGYPLSICQSSAPQPPSGGPPSQQYYGLPTQIYKPPVSRPSPGFPPGYGTSSGTNFSDSYPYGGPSSHYSSSTMKPPQLPFSPSAPSGGSSYPRLPTAQVLPHALPTAGRGSNSSGTGNRVPIDDVVDKVSTMGFSREQVRATVRKLTENGQPVDLNVVLDKLMNDGEIQPPKGMVW